DLQPVSEQVRPLDRATSTVRVDERRCQNGPDVTPRTLDPVRGAVELLLDVVRRTTEPVHHPGREGVERLLRVEAAGGDLLPDLRTGQAHLRPDQGRRVHTTLTELHQVGSGDLPRC